MNQLLLRLSLTTQISNHIGLSLAEIKQYSPNRFRRFLEEKNGKSFSFCSEFPTIGRGNVLRDSLTTSKQLNRSVDKILNNDRK